MRDCERPCTVEVGENIRTCTENAVDQGHRSSGGRALLRAQHLGYGAERKGLVVVERVLHAASIGTRSGQCDPFEGCRFFLINKLTQQNETGVILHTPSTGTQNSLPMTGSKDPESYLKWCPCSHKVYQSSKFHRSSTDIRIDSCGQGLQNQPA